MSRLFKIISFGCAGLITLVLIVATIIESLYGSLFVIEYIYHSYWFIALWLCLAVAAVVYILCASRRISLILLHFSFVVVLLGAFVSFLSSKRGGMELVQEGAPASMFEMSDGALHKLPFRLQLLGVDTLYSKENGTPDDYKAYILSDDKKECTQHIISLNSPVEIDGYQFCIKGVDDNGISLLVSYDRYGRTISYLGYLMVFLSFLMLFFDKKSGFVGTLLLLQGKKSGNAGADNVKHSEFLSPRDLAGRIGCLMLCVVVLLSLFWYKRGVFPAANGAEALLLLGVTTAILAGIFRFKRNFSHLAKPLAMLSFVACVIAVRNIEWSDDVQPILRTPLLGIHVTTIIIAYALLACTALNAVIALCTKDSERRARQALLGRAMLYPATMLLASGIFVGAVWANLSWGRYWGWDPKEVWALVTLLVCSVAFHTHSLRFIAKPVTFHIFCIVAFVAVLFTFFGVNYLLGGLHSYA